MMLINMSKVRLGDGLEPHHQEIASYHFVFQICNTKRRNELEKIKKTT